MATQQITAGDSDGGIPVACSLTSADLRAQARRWEQLAARAMIERAETPRGLRLSFRPGPGVEPELRNLVTKENECCRWANWTMETYAEQFVLDVRSAGEGIAVLHSMFTSLQPDPAHLG